MMSPMCSRLMAKDDNLHRAAGLALAETFAGNGGDVELDGFVQPVDRVVHALDRATNLRSSVMKAAMVLRSIVSTRSPMCNVSRAAQVSATDGVVTAAESR